jgi:hypothetical protein
MDIGKIAESVMAMDDAAWERHTNPWSGWSRISALPLVTLAIWSRVWIGWWAVLPLLLCLVWIWINPRIFAKPASTANWMSRGVLGERIWLARHESPIPSHHAKTSAILNGGALVGAVIYAVGLFQLHLCSTLAGLGAMMLFKLWFLDRMVWLYIDTQAKTDGG